VGVKIIIGLLVILGISMIGARKSFVRMRLPFLTQYLFLTGTEFILIGLFLGSNFLNILDEKTLSSLGPFLSLVLGWIGFLFGVQVEFRKLRMFPPSYWMGTVIQSMVTMALVFSVFYWLFWRMVPGEPAFVLAACVVLSAAAGVTAQSVPALVAEEMRAPRVGIVRLVRYISSLDGLVGLGIFGLLFCYIPPVPSGETGLFILLRGLAVSVGLGLIVGFLFNSFMFHKASNEELLLIVIGMVTFSGGIAAYLHLAPLFVCMVMGILVVNLSPARERVMETLVGAEKPVYLILLVLAGATWRVGGAEVFLLAGVYWSARLVGKMLGGYLAIRNLAAFPCPRTVGVTLVSQGGVAVAMVLGFQRAYPSDVTDTVVAIVLLAVMVNELISPYLARRVFDRYCEET